MGDSMVCVTCNKDTQEIPCQACGDPEPRLQGRYGLVRRLGSGSHGTTWEALDTQAEEPVAVKELPLRPGLPAKTRELYARETRVLAQLKHDRIPAYRAHFEQGEGKGRTLYIVSDYIAGPTLGERAESHRFNEDEVLGLVAELLAILDYLHGLSPPVVHRDLKPSNVIVSADGLALVDFGSVRDALRDPDVGGSTVAGTFGFMAPEQFAGDAEPRSDLYAVGATAVTLLTRKAPHTLTDHANRVRWAEHANVSPATEALIDALVDPDIEGRPSSAADALARLRRIQAGEKQLPVLHRPALLAAPTNQSLISRALVGPPAVCEVSATTPARVPVSMHTALADAIQGAIGVHGLAATLGEGMHWRPLPSRGGAAFDVRIDPVAEGTRVTLRVDLRQVAGGLYGGLVGGLGGGLGGGAAFPAFLLGGPVGAAAFVVACVLGSYGLARVAYTRTQQGAERKIERLLPVVVEAVERLGEH